MSEFFRSVVIESVEQAAALPEGAIVTQEDRDGPWEKWPDGSFRGAAKTVVGPERVVGRFALVPFEAEASIPLTPEGRAAQREAWEATIAEVSRPAPMFYSPVGPWHRWFAWRPVDTVIHGWKWLRPVERRRVQSHLHLPGPIDQCWQYRIPGGAQ